MRRGGTVQTKWKRWEDLMEKTQAGVYGYKHVFLGKATEDIFHFEMQIQISNHHGDTAGSPEHVSCFQTDF